MVVKTEVGRKAREAARKRMRMLRGLREYYLGDMTIGLLSEKLGIPLRALIDSMQKYGLPYKSSEEDRKIGLEKVNELLER